MADNEIVFGYNLLLYFFLSGTSGGAFLWATLLTLFSKEEKLKKLALYEALVSMLCLAAGATLLLLDLGHPLRFWRLLVVPLLNPTSAIAWGSVIIPAHFLMLSAYVFANLTKNGPLAVRISYAGLIIATLLMTYTGLLLSICKAFPLWHSAVLVPVFFASGCLSGLALLIIIGFGTGILSAEDEIVRHLRRLLILLLVMDGVVFTDYYVLYTGLADSYAVFELVVLGRLAFVFWVIEVALGFLAPVIILLSPYGRTKKGLVIASVLAIIGVLAMRYIIVIGGQMIPV